MAVVESLRHRDFDIPRVRQSNLGERKIPWRVSLTAEPQTASLACLGSKRPCEAPLDTPETCTQLMNGSEIFTEVKVKQSR